MKKVNVKSFMMGVIVTAAVGTSTFVFAASNQTINVVMDKIKLVVNGKSVEQPTILYNGTTYAPFRQIGEAFGQNVHYDDQTGIAYIGDAGVPENIKNGTTPAPSPAPTGDTYTFFENSVPSFKKYASNEVVGDTDDYDEQKYIYLNVVNIDQAVSSYEQDLVNAGYTRTEYKQEGPYTEKYEYKKGNIEVQIKKLPKSNNKVLIELELD